VTDPILYVSFFIFGFYLAGRVAVRFRVVSNVPWYLGDPVHFGLGMFVTRVDVAYAVLISALYIVYQLWSDRRAKDVAAYTAGIVAGLGGSYILI